MMEKQKYVVLVAGGSGSRMGSGIPKQFLPLIGKPVLIHTIEQFRQIEGVEIILVLPEKDISLWKEIISHEDFSSPYLATLKVIAGGETRFQSVRNGLAHVPDEALVAIHDGVRPLISADIIQKSFDVAEEVGNAVASVALKDSIREVNTDGKNRATERSGFRLIQTPQTFHSELIKKAYNTPEQANFTDCASVLEAAGSSIQLIEGSYENLKITTPDDLIIAEALLRNRKTYSQS